MRCAYSGHFVRPYGLAKWSRGDLNPRAIELDGYFYACSRLFDLNRGTVVDNLPFGPVTGVISLPRPEAARGNQPEIVDPAPIGRRCGIVTT
jgi:hypothetical protein